MKRRTAWAVLVAANVLLLGVLSLQRTTSGAPGAPSASGGNLPFANAVEQRAETIRVLQEINEQLKQQNALLRSGGLKVMVVQPESPPPKP